MYLTVTWANAAGLTGPYSNSDSSGKGYISTAQPSLNLPVAQWTHIEVFLKEWPHDVTPFQGRFTVWQDGVQMFDLGGPTDNSCGLGAGNCPITTKYGDDTNGTNFCHGNNAWSVNIYDDGISPDPGVIYIDDAIVSQTRETPLLPPTNLRATAK